jgi:hypothetical protein
MALLAGKMLHKPKQYLAKEVLSRSVHDILIQKPPPFYGNEALPAGKIPILYLIDD